MNWSIFILPIFAFCSLSPESGSNDKEAVLKLSHLTLIRQVLSNEQSTQTAPHTYPAVFDTQSIGNERVTLISCSHSDGDSFHVDSRFKSPDGIVFGLDIKYMNDCNYKLGKKSSSPDDSHPLVREYAFLQILRDQGITPRVSHLSPPIEDSGSRAQVVKYNMLTTTVDRKFSFANLPDSQSCENVGSTTRFISYESVGITVISFYDLVGHHFKSEISRLLSVIDMGIKSIKLVQSMHNLGIVHGNMGGWAIRFKYRKANHLEYDFSTDELVLVDLQNAFFISDPPPDLTEPPTRLGLWHLESNEKKIGMRDDIYPIAELIADLISEGAVRKSLLQAESKDSGALKVAKKTLELFPRRGLLGTLGLGSKRYELSEKFMNIVRGMGDKEAPPYEEILSTLSQIRNTLSDEGNGLFTRVFG